MRTAAALMKVSVNDCFLENFREALELCKEDWVRDDLTTITSNGLPLCSSTAKLTVRRADEAEIVIYGNGAIQAQTGDLVHILSI